VRRKWKSCLRFASAYAIRPAIRSLQQPASLTRLHGWPASTHTPSCMNQASFQRMNLNLVDLKAGKSYLLCTCGTLKRSNRFCDGSHGRQVVLPLSFTPIPGGESRHLCRLQQTDHPPYLRWQPTAQVSDEQVGQPLSHSDSGAGFRFPMQKKDSVRSSLSQLRCRNPIPLAVEPYVAFIHEFG